MKVIANLFHGEDKSKGGSLIRKLWPFLILLIFGLSNSVIGQPEGITDADISQAIENELLWNEAVPSHLIDVSTMDGIVTLSGSVNNILALDKAMKIAQSVRGVKSVINEIEVKGKALPDSQVKNNVESRLFNDPVTKEYNVNINVEDGVVTLTGEVDSWKKKRITEQVAKTARGVKGVKNRLSVQFAQERPDDEIRKEIIRMMELDVVVNHNLVDVIVEDGRVTLSGSVGSAAEKHEAISIAYVAGVESVNAEELEVKPWARDLTRTDGRPVDKSDQDIEIALKEALLHQPRISSFDIMVEVEDNIAILSGEVSNLKAKDAAEQTAENTLGVWEVENNIKVRPETLPGEKALRQKVKEALEQVPYIRPEEITFNIFNNKVYLYGSADKYFDKWWAREVVARLEGVVSVDNNIRVDKEWSWKSDERIRENVNDEFFWSLNVDGDDINVSVKDGEVILSGTVDTMFEHNAAIDNALEAGAKSVTSNLKIKYGPQNFRQDYFLPLYNYAKRSL